ncbi:hypothetical protein 7t3_0479 [Salmonella phage 7t3]|nr:hypothetical protein 7t3_0479 [Salmonella phage 7t3]
MCPGIIIISHFSQNVPNNFQDFLMTSCCHTFVILLYHKKSGLSQERENESPLFVNPFVQ